jgi:hypothetical protein
MAAIKRAPGHWRSTRRMSCYWPASYWPASRSTGPVELATPGQSLSRLPAQSPAIGGRFSHGPTASTGEAGSVHMHRYIPTLLAVVVSVGVRSELEAL